MDDYKQLSKLFYADASAGRFATNAEEAARRLQSPATFRTGIMLQSGTNELGELFLSVPRELSFLSEEVLRVERKVSRLWSGLPGLARWAYLRSLILDEIVSTNEIEGIHSSRRQISEALNIVRERSSGAHKARFVELGRLYLELTDRRHIYPRTPEDIRAIYDRVVAGEIEKQNLPDGRLFRAGAVDIWAPNNKVKHTGVFPEAKIEQMVSQMIDLVEKSALPAVYSAFLAHFLFEFIHPFYDGNGRTGRYLLALYLSEPLSLTTALSLSRVIAEHKNDYYKAFETVEHPLNHAEATFFVLTMMGFVRIAQNEAIEQLERKEAQLAEAGATLNKAQARFGLSPKATQLLYFVVQYALFDEFGEVSLADAATYMQASSQTARRYFGELEEQSAVMPISRRPLRYVLTDRARELFGIACG